MPLSQLTPSYRAHLTLMLCCLIFASAIVFFLVAGWRSHFDGIARRQELARLSERADNRFPGMSAYRGIGVHEQLSMSQANIAVAAERPVRNGVGERITLANLASPSEGDAFPALVPCTVAMAPERMADALEVLRRFTNASSWQEKLSCVIDKERVEPLMRTYYEGQSKAAPTISSTLTPAHFKLNQTEVLLFSSPSGGASELAMVSPTPGGRFLVDWESFVGASDASWQDFKRMRSTHPALFRLFAQRDDYFNYEFSDASQYLSVRLTSPEGEQFIFGYCDKDSAIGKTLASLLDQSKARLPLTLRLAYPENAQSDHCVKIVGVIANRWLVVR